jgi:hypothetical protein
MSKLFSKSSTIAALRLLIANKYFPTMGETYERICVDLESGKILAAEEKDCLIWLNNVLDGARPQSFEQICRQAERRAERDAENAVTGFSNY